MTAVEVALEQVLRVAFRTELALRLLRLAEPQRQALITAGRLVHESAHLVVLRTAVALLPLQLAGRLRQD